MCIYRNCAGTFLKCLEGLLSILYVYTLYMLLCCCVAVDISQIILQQLAMFVLCEEDVSSSRAAEDHDDGVCFLFPEVSCSLLDG